MLGIYTNETEVKVNTLEIDFNEAFEKFREAECTIFEHSAYARVAEVEDVYFKEFYKYRNRAESYDKFFFNKCDVYNKLIEGLDKDNIKLLIETAEANIRFMEREDKVSCIYFLAQDLEDAFKRKFKKEREEIENFDKFIQGGKR